MTSPLDGLLVVDLTRIVAGPHCTKILRDLGARVIKVELRSDMGDMLRYFEPKAGEGEQTTCSGYFAQFNGGKESIALDLSLAEGGRPQIPADRQAFEALLTSADVLVENFRPGRLDRLGYSWEVLHRKYPRIVLCSISGFGQTGPYRNRGGVDTIIQAMSGFVSTTGTAEEPVKVGTTVSDLLSGVYAAVGIQAALLARSRSGEGRHVDISMLDSSAAFHAREIASYSLLGKEPVRAGNRTTVSPSMGIFECADRLKLAFAGSWDGQVLGEALGDAELEQDKRFRGYDACLKHSEALHTSLARAFRRRDRAVWVEELSQKGFPVGPVNSIADLVCDPQLKQRGMLRRTHDGRFLVVGNPVKVSGWSENAEAEAAPALDANGSALRAEFLRDQVRSKL